MGRRTDWAASSSESDVPSVAASRSTSTATLPPPQPTNAAAAQIESKRFMLLPPGFGGSSRKHRQRGRKETGIAPLQSPTDPSCSAGGGAHFVGPQTSVARPVDRYRCSMVNE